MGGRLNETVRGRWEKGVGAGVGVGANVGAGVEDEDEGEGGIEEVFGCDSVFFFWEGCAGGIFLWGG